MLLVVGLTGQELQSLRLYGRRGRRAQDGPDLVCSVREGGGGETGGEASHSAEDIVSHLQGTGRDLGIYFELV